MYTRTILLILISISLVAADDNDDDIPDWVNECLPVILKAINVADSNRLECAKQAGAIINGDDVYQFEDEDAWQKYSDCSRAYDLENTEQVEIIERCEKLEKDNRDFITEDQEKRIDEYFNQLVKSLDSQAQN